MQMRANNSRYNWMFKLGCLSMFTLVALGARYGHRGKLGEEGSKYFQKAQLYHMANSNSNL